MGGKPRQPWLSSQEINILIGLCDAQQSRNDWDVGCCGSQGLVDDIGRSDEALERCKTKLEAMKVKGHNGWKTKT